MAERVGFEPTVRLPGRLLSRQLHSTALPSLHDSIAIYKVLYAIEWYCSEKSYFFPIDFQGINHLAVFFGYIPMFFMQENIEFSSLFLINIYNIDKILYLAFLNPWNIVSKRGSITQSSEANPWKLKRSTTSFRHSFWYSKRWCIRMMELV